MQANQHSSGAAVMAPWGRFRAVGAVPRQQLWIRAVLVAVYAIATLQWMWCYADLVKPYLSVQMYERGLERMPFQGRYLLVLPLRLVHGSAIAAERAQFLIDTVALVVAGYFTVRLYKAASKRRLLTWAVYPIFLAACAGTYILRSVQNLRYPYDLTSLAFFAGAMYLLYSRKHWIYFAALFVLATTNRETTLFLLLLYLVDEAALGKHLARRWPVQRQTVLLVASLGGIWLAWHLLVQHRFALNPRETESHLWSNLQALHSPRGLTQVLAIAGGLLVFSIATRRVLPNARLRAWFWIIPVWFVFMLLSGIVVETRVFGELSPFAVVASVLVAEDMLAGAFGAPAAEQDDVSEFATEGRIPNSLWTWALVSAELLLAGAAVGSLLWSRPLPIVHATVESPTLQDTRGLPWPEHLLKEEQFARAVPLLEAFVAAEPSNVKAWIDLCEAHSQLREFNQARNACERGLQVDPHQTRLKELLHSTEYRAQQWTMTGFKLQEVPPANRDSDYYVDLGRYRMDADDAQAARAFEQAVQLDDRNVVAVTELGVARMRLRQYQRAEAAFEQVLALEPENVQVQQDLAWARQEQTAR